MPESKIRSSVAERKSNRRAALAKEAREQNISEQARLKGAAVRLGDPRTWLNGSRDWVPKVFIPVGLLGVAWIVVYSIAGNAISFMGAIGNFNILIGMGLIALAFIISTLWK